MGSISLTNKLHIRLGAGDGIVPIVREQGLYSDADTAPCTTTVLLDDPNIIDDDRNTRSAFNYWLVNYSTGCKLEGLSLVSEIVLWGDTNGTTEHTAYYSANHGTFDLYTGTANGTWTFLERFVEPPFDCTSGQIRVDVTLTLSTPTIAQYWKVVAPLAGIAYNPGGASMRMTNWVLT